MRFFALWVFAVSVACASETEPSTFVCDAGLVCQTATQACVVETTTGGVLHDGGATALVTTSCEPFGAGVSCDCMGLPDSGDSCNTETCTEVNGGVTLRAHLCQ